ncbi:phosphoribosylglycinamide formyltransferase [Agarilytica rhodophyticola]|uniref:phosphoribosylglycinamide formyltransferase n=1 Tax=Agarilytica rhodophyticola TaxID=1737490 RepID=UPI000B340FE8|nr:phosphoribosylglycinamide formyltransferase [Agarilytica rhodophyticola]
MEKHELKPARVVILISGGGTNLQTIIDQQEAGKLPITICAVISNRDDVQGIQRAQKHNIPVIVLEHNQFPSRESFDGRLQDIIDSQNPDIVVLAGFMRILTPDFTRHYEGKMINIHPSLLPHYQGLHTHRRVLEAGDLKHGATVHFVTAQLDGGPAIIQSSIEVEKSDSEESLKEKVLRQEHKIFPLAIRWLAEKRVVMREEKAFLDGEELAVGGVQFDKNEI